MRYFAAIGKAYESDDLIIWGVGESEPAALADAAKKLCPPNPRDLICVRVPAARARAALRGSGVAASDLVERCSGEAHSNAHIDNCMQCAPRWGWIVKTGRKR